LKVPLFENLVISLQFLTTSNLPHQPSAQSQMHLKTMYLIRSVFSVKLWQFPILYLFSRVIYT